MYWFNLNDMIIVLQVNIVVHFNYNIALNYLHLKHETSYIPF